MPITHLAVEFVGVGPSASTEHDHAGDDAALLSVQLLVVHRQRLVIVFLDPVAIHVYTRFNALSKAEINYNAGNQLLY